MFSFLTRLFKRDKKVMPYGTTLNTADVGESSKRKMNPDIDDVLNNINKSNNVSNTDLNKICSYYFNTPEIASAYYRLNPTMSKGMTFTIKDIHITYTDKRDVSDVVLVLEEGVYNAGLEVKLTVKNFHEFFEKVPFMAINAQ